MSKPVREVCKVMCATCPFRAGSPYANLAEHLTLSALSEGSRICHQTGTNGIGGRTGKAPRLCRGARDAQINLFVALGFLDAPTDEAWAAKLKQIESGKP